MTPTEELRIEGSNFLTWVVVTWVFILYQTYMFYGLFCVEISRCKIKENKAGNLQSHLPDSSLNELIHTETFTETFCVPGTVLGAGG